MYMDQSVKLRLDQGEKKLEVWKNSETRKLFVTE